MYKQKMITLGVLAALCVLASMSMQARAQEARGQSGMTVVRDPQTGKLRAPTPEELRELRAKAPPAKSLGAAPREQQLTRRDGAKGVRLGEKSLVYEVVTRGPDGKLSSQCVHGEAAAHEAMSHPAAQHEEHAHEAR